MGTSDREDTAGMNPDELRAAVALVAKPDSRLQLGDFEIDGEGRLRSRADAGPIAFGFSYCGVDFIAEVDTGPDAQVSLCAELGKLPYRAESSERRRMTRCIVVATERLPHGRISVSESQDMCLNAKAPAPRPLTPASVVATLATILLDFKPYLDLLHDVMFAPPMLES